jgi:thiosulfate reductase cytochrome b subunit
MKLPAVAIAAAFAGGIALGLHPAVAPHVTSAFLLSTCFLGVLFSLSRGYSSQE